VPSLDLCFADKKDLICASSGRQLVTFARASSGTYVDSAGVLSTATTNLLLRSEEFNDASWTKTGFLAFGSGSTANATTAPDGTLTSDLLTESTALSERTCYQSGFTTTTSATLSCYIKPNGRNFAGLRFYASGNNWVRVTFTLTGSGSASAIAAGSASDYSTTSASITTAGNGWYRVSLSATRAGGVSYATIDFATSASPTLYAPLGNELYTGNGTSGIYLWGAQLEQSSTVGEYIPTGSTINSAPRFDHNPLTGESLGLLVEEQRTNLLLQSNAFTTHWSSVANTLTSASAVSPDGTTNGWRFADTAANNTHNIFQTIAWTAVATTFTVYAKYDTHRWIGARIGNTGNQFFGSWDLQNGVVGSFTAGATIGMQAVGNGWYRLTLTATLTSAGSANVLLYLNNADSASAITYAGTGTGSYIYGAQLEAGATASSYIPTTTAAATRNADVASITGTNFSSWYRQDEGTVYAEALTQEYTVTTFPRVFSIDNGGAASSFIALVRGSNTRRWDYSVFANGTGQAVGLNNGISPSAGAVCRGAVIYRANDFTGATQGVLMNADTSGSVPTVNALGIGMQSNATLQFNGHIRRLVFWRQALPGQLQAITQP
jgi:hypothetical protein